MKAALYRFATYTGAKTERLEITDDHVTWTVANKSHRLDMVAERSQGGLLYGPTRQEMHKRVDETLKATVAVTLRTRSGQALFQGVGRNAGMEVHGDLERLLRLQKSSGV